MKEHHEDWIGVSQRVEAGNSEGEPGTGSCRVSQAMVKEYRLHFTGDRKLLQGFE